MIEFFTSETFGFLLKLFAGLATAAFGILGIGTETRDRQGKLTRNGWIALIGIVVAGLFAIGTSVYEFSNGQVKAEQDRLKSEQLLRSVRRGIYPFRGMTVSYSLDFDQGIPGIAEYKAKLRRAIADNKENCKNEQYLTCTDFDNRSVKPIGYSIPSTSPLFPKKSEFITTIKGAFVTFEIYRRSPGKEDERVDSYKFLGEFSAGVWTNWKSEWWLSYDLRNDHISATVERVEIPDAELAGTKLYSLVDFVPGLMVASPSFSNDFACSLDKTPECESNTSAARHLMVHNIQLGFRYPKYIEFDPKGIECSGNHFDTIFMLKDVDSSSNVGNLRETIPDEEKTKACEAITDPEKKMKPRDI